MMLSQLTEKRLMEIFLLYDRIIGGRIRDYALMQSSPPFATHLAYINKQFSSGNAAEFCYGSNLNGGEQNTKLIVWYESGLYQDKKLTDKLIRFSFDTHSIDTEESRNMRSDFEEAADKLLVKWGVNIDL
jgi:hypothetical protein